MSNSTGRARSDNNGGGAAEPAHYSHINEFDGKRIAVLRNKRGVVAVYEAWTAG